MSRNAALGAFLFEAESSWGENVTTYANRLTTVDPPDVSGLEQAKIASNRTVQRMDEYSPPIRSVMGGSFTTKIYLAGHGSTTAGAISVEEHETILGYAIGNATSTGTGTTATAGATTTVIPTAAANGLTVGGIVFVGALGDAAGNGQPGLVSTHFSSNLTLLNALDAAPANGAVVASSVTIYPNGSASSATVTSTRWRILTANHCYECHGVFPMSISIDGLSPGEVPTATITWGVSWFADVAPTFPTATAGDTFVSAPNAAGSLFIREASTSTRDKYVCRSFRLNVDLGIVPLMGPGGVNAFQHIVGAVRTMHTVTAEVVVDTGSASASPTWASRWDSETTTYYNLLYGLNGAATGRRIAVCLPYCFLDDRRPVQLNDGGVNRERLFFRASSTATSTSEQSYSSWRLALG